MAGLLWLIVAILVIAWLLGLGGVFHAAVALVWVILVAAVVLALLAFMTGGSPT
jgi:hypothetical protein